MSFLRTVFSGLALMGLATMASAQQAAAPYTHATRYNAAGQVTGVIAPDPDGTGILAFHATRNTYGTSGQTAGLLIKVEMGELASWANETVAPSGWESHGFAPYLTRTIEYDSRGRKSAERVIGADLLTESLTQWSYDDWNRVRCMAVRMNKAAFASPPADACILGAEGSDGPDRITRYTYNSFDLVLTEERAVGTSVAQTNVTNAYELDTRLLRFQTDANGNKTELQYDEHKRLSRRIYPSPSSPGSVNTADFNEYDFDNNGNVILERKRGGQTITNTFDANNRLTFKNLSDNSHSADIIYNFDLRGLTLSSCFGSSDACTTSGSGETNQFDGFGNLTSRISRMGGVSRTLTYAPDLEGNRTRITHADGTAFSYGFDGLNRMCTVAEGTTVAPCDGSTHMLKVTYRPSGHRLDLIRPSGAVTNIDLDNALRLKSFTQNFALTANDLTNEFWYNPASQIVKLRQSNSLYTNAELSSRTGNYGRNGLNQITSIAGNALTHDTNGNLTADGAGMTFTYDMENHLVATGGLVSSTLVYDVLGRLSQITVGGQTTQFHYDGDALIGEFVSGALTRRYVHGDQVDEPLVQYNGAAVGASFRRYLHADHQGTIIAHSGNTGSMLQINAYDAYGIPKSTNDGRFGYTGQTWMQQIGLNYYKARVYSPKLGRFLQTDPIYYRDDMNSYAYVGNSPINARDPTGTICAYNCPERKPKPAPEPKTDDSKKEEDKKLDEVVVTGKRVEMTSATAIGRLLCSAPAVSVSIEVQADAGWIGGGHTAAGGYRVNSHGQITIYAEEGKTKGPAQVGSMIGIGLELGVSMADEPSGVSQTKSFTMAAKGAHGLTGGGGNVDFDDSGGSVSIGGSLNAGYGGFLNAGVVEGVQAATPSMCIPTEAVAPAGD